MAIGKITTDKTHRARSLKLLVLAKLPFSRAEVRLLNSDFGGRTSGEVGEVVGGEQYRRAVPPPVSEQLLADVDHLSRGADHHRHQLEVAPTDEALVLLQAHRARRRAVGRAVPRRLLASAAQRPAVAVHTENVSNAFNV